VTGFSLRPIDAYIALPRPQAPSPSVGAAADPSGFAAEPDGATVLPRLRPARSLPFLAQYLAQEIVEPGETAPRWGARDSAYRLAGDRPATPHLDLAV
jgi:hypothetical protein